MPLFIEPRDREMAWYKGENPMKVGENGFKMNSESRQAELGNPKFLPGTMVSFTVKCPFDKNQPSWHGEGVVEYVYTAGVGESRWYTVRCTKGGYHQTHEQNLVRMTV